MAVMSIFIPFRKNFHRYKQFDWLQRKWKQQFPEAEIIVSEDDGNEPFSKTIAVNNCYKKATTDIFAILDADVWVEPEILKKATKKIRKKKVAWVRPCQTAFRINEETTNNIIQSCPNSTFPLIYEDQCERISSVVGLVCIFHRKHFEYVGGMDPRFRGWGGEDHAWNILLDNISGRASFWKNTVFHLWHPRLFDDAHKQIWLGQTQSNRLVEDQYIQNKNNPNFFHMHAHENRKRTGIRPKFKIRSILFPHNFFLTMLTADAKSHGAD